jgi:hypothetical protein
MDYLHATTGGVLVNIWFPVRHNDDALAVEVAAERVLEPLWRPKASQTIRLPLGRQAFNQVTNVSKERLEFRSLAVASEKPPKLVAPPTPRQPCRHNGDHGGCGREEPECEQQEPPGRGFAALDEAQVMDEDKEADGLVAIKHGDGGDVDIAARE